MTLTFETEHFIVKPHPKPFLPRLEGGHLRIEIKDTSIEDRTELVPEVAIEFMRLTMVVGKAFPIAMKRRGIDIIKLNYQDMGNWAFKEGKRPCLHLHIFGRTANAVKQPWPESMYLPDRGTGFYEGFDPLTDEDMSEIIKEIERIFKEEKYKDERWFCKSV
ncbi:MAG TPA: hypothetical protein DCS29_03870 [Candidatus Magasanikbacteria bacterium]|nr:MAG: hypothetical protein A2479_03780 [Candidatus Magasanikbacteria bacterium RIFOXYC2_FULL_39_8]HAT03881.1 hypothetical protein [Candidatus Magasanikbacteria bacterium]